MVWPLEQLTVGLASSRQRAQRMRGIARISKAALTYCLIGLLAIGLVGCSGLAVVATFQPAGNVVTVSGVVSIVQIITIQGPTGTTTVTVVTFIGQSTSSTINFCGNLGNQFSTNTFTTVNFTNGQGCGNVVTIWIG
jgi:hypothetical protein